MSYMVQNPGRGSKDDCTSPLHNMTPQGSSCRGSVHCKLILLRIWHTSEIPLSLEGEEGTGAEPDAWRPAQHLLAIAPQLAAAVPSRTGGQLALGSVTAIFKQSYQLIQGIPMENALLLYFQEKQ